ncbi:MAG TPA: hypothetical protein PKI75_02100 [Candidatus Woesebacteria bacterium]|nr:hypothetical protein [Candidatus Woesebacteria bacterium]
MKEKLLIADIADVIGKISPPPGVEKWGDIGVGGKGGIIGFANVLIKLLIVGGGIFTFVNILLAGLTYISAGGDSKKIEQATNKIIYSVVGLVIMAGSLVAAAIIGFIVFGDATAILNPKIYGPQ